MDKETSKAGRTRKFIIEATAGIFNTKGYAGTSMSDLTEATGLTKGSIYGNFENKEEVALAVFDYSCAKIAQVVHEQIDKAKSFHDKLMVYARVYRKLMRKPLDNGGCPILNTAIEADDTNELLKAKAAKAIMKWEREVARLIEGGIAAGEFRRKINVRQASISIVALIEGGVMIARVTGEPGNLDKILATVEVLVGDMRK